MGKLTITKDEMIKAFINYVDSDKTYIESIQYESDAFVVDYFSGYDVDKKPILCFHNITIDISKKEFKELRTKVKTRFDKAMIDNYNLDIEYLKKLALSEEEILLSHFNENKKILKYVYKINNTYYIVLKNDNIKNRNKIIGIFSKYELENALIQFINDELLQKMDISTMKKLL